MHLTLPAPPFAVKPAATRFGLPRYRPTWTRVRLCCPFLQCSAPCHSTLVVTYRRLFAFLLALAGTGLKLRTFVWFHFIGRSRRWRVTFRAYPALNLTPTCYAAPLFTFSNLPCSAPSRFIPFTLHFSAPLLRAVTSVRRHLHGQHASLRRLPVRYTTRCFVPFSQADNNSPFAWQRRRCDASHDTERCPHRCTCHSISAFWRSGTFRHSQIRAISVYRT